MAAPLPPEVREGDPLPGASWFKALRDFLVSTRVSVARDSGLQAKDSPAGLALGVVFPAGAVLATTTSVIPIRAGDTLGKGTATIRQVTVDPAGVAKWVTVPGNITIYNDDAADPVASGKKVQLKALPGGILIVDVDYCSGS